MAFLAPAFLALGLLAGVPVLVHFLRRRIGRTVDFPAVRYLARMEQEHSKDLKLKNRLLLLLRIIACLALALAAARPIARLFGVGHAPVALALVIDNSMSSGVVADGRARFDSVRAEARRVLNDLSGDDRAWLVTADGRVIGGAPAALTEALTTMTPLGGRGNLTLATQRALGLARSGAPRTPVVALVSDGQRSEFVSDSVVDAGAIPIVALTVGGSAVANRAVLEARPDPVRWTPSGSVSLAVAANTTTPWRLTLDGRTVARGDAPAATMAAPARITQKLASTGSGWMRGSVELDADALRADDTRWFAIRVAPPPMVVVRNEGGPFLSAALGTLVDEGRLARGTPADARAVMVGGADADGTRLPVLLTAPADPLRVGDANRQLARLNVPWRFGAIARGQVLARVPSATSDTASPAVRAFEGTPVRLRYPLVYSPGGGAATGVPAPDTLATAGGTPWVVAGAGYVLIGSPLEPEATDLPLRASFVPWVLESLARRLGDDGRLIETVPGATITGVREATGLEQPDGKVIPLSGDRLTVPSSAGVYFLRRQAARIGALVVNAEPEESDVAGMAQENGNAAAGMLASLVRGKDVAVMRAAPAWRSAIFAHAAGQALLLPLVALALAALLAEAYLSGR
jgi:hypothetical protein